MQRLRQLKTVERVPAGGVEQSADDQPGKSGADFGPDHRLEGVEIQRTDAQSGEALGLQADRGCGTLVGPIADGREQADWLVTEPPQSEVHRRRARRVEP